MLITVQNLCRILDEHRSYLHRIVHETGYQPTRPGRGGLGNAERYSCLDAYAITEMTVLRRCGYPVSLLQHIIRVWYSTLSEDEAIALVLGEPLHYLLGEELAEAKGIQNVLYPPAVMKACKRATDRLAKLVRAKLATT
jgi:hypothetical protein